ncbi:2-keto-3-deoxy-galactonokinase [Aquimixticola soesokkakensis]|uniref:2-keto-3-deoxy-galactonokinase n=1 Tax=Aquimixticola soesokkakensis TaxID=1519096 RepID=A0A1Y5RKH4_9RHOB|nr:2-dehydro-3-deoxygalactonokinase [Aquimixticola soesokkakensis]SLN19413.1 2-keto-3-deoxy-galactonokinase [Aquimixticola soesokkakensis]
MKTDWIAVEIDRDEVRAWAVDRDGAVNDHARARDTDLAQLIAPWRGAGRPLVLVSGETGSPASFVPCKPFATLPNAQSDAGIDLRLVPAIAQNAPADVMRGDVVRIAGFMTTNPQFDGVLCMTGPVSRWVHVSAGEIVSFQSFVTGELIDSLVAASVLRHTVGSSGADDVAFQTGFEDGFERPERLLTRIYSLHAEAEREGLAPGLARARLRGLVMGTELAVAKPYWLGQQIAVIGQDDNTKRYTEVLRAQGCPVITADRDTMTMAGFRAARAQIG